MTQENLHAPGYKKRQKRITIKGHTFWADKKMIPLLKILNKYGLITRSHCQGHHNGNPSWIIFRMKNITQVEIRNDGEYKELILSWRK